MTNHPQSDGLDQLRGQFPGWAFGSAWVAAASGPDKRRVVAFRGKVTLSAWTAEDLAEAITREEAE